MKIELFKADFVGDEYHFTQMPYTGTVPIDVRSGGFTYTPNEVEYHDCRFFLYCNHELNEYELKKLKEDWRRYCPN